MKLFTPYTLKNLQLRNHIVMPPMCMYSAGTDGMPTDFHFTHYTSRAVGGVGLIIMEATAVIPCGRISDHCLGLWNDGQAEALAPVVAACRKQGAAMAIQLNHAGRKCEADEPVVYAPSAIPFDEKSPMPREMTRADIQDTVQAFRAAAARAAAAGFDIVEIHAAHGYLLSEFLSPLTNIRTDEYGGSTENRTRLLKEVLEAVHEVWPAERPVEMARILKIVKPYVDMVDISTGGVVPTPPPALYPGYQLKAAEYIRQQVGLPTIAVGLLTDPHHVEEILCGGRADLTALGRALLRDPYWVLHAARELDLDYPWPEQYLRGFKVRK